PSLIREHECDWPVRRLLHAVCGGSGSRITAHERLNPNQRGRVRWPLLVARRWNCFIEFMAWRNGLLRSRAAGVRDHARCWNCNRRLANETAKTNPVLAAAIEWSR